MGRVSKSPADICRPPFWAVEGLSISTLCEVSCVLPPSPATLVPCNPWRSCWTSVCHEELHTCPLTSAPDGLQLCHLRLPPRVGWAAPKVPSWLVWEQICFWSSAHSAGVFWVPPGGSQPVLSTMSTERRSQVWLGLGDGKGGREESRKLGCMSLVQALPARHCHPATSP